MPYLMAGYPTLAQSGAALEAALSVGVDLLELGVPYSDPLADGPVIHAAASEALRAGTRLGDVLALAAEYSEAVPIVLMVYANQLFAQGIEPFLERCAEAGVVGVIVPDLPAEEAEPVREACARLGLALVMLVAPNTKPQRLAQIATVASGFLYAVSVLGTTGERSLEELRYREVVSLARSASDLPVAVGFGVASAGHARAAVEAGADGVIVGSRLVRALGEHGPEGVRAALEEVATGLGELAARR